MGERRKRKSLWDQEGTNQSFGVSEHNSRAGKEHDSHHDIGQSIGHNSEFSASGSYLESRDHSGQPSVTSIANTPVAPMHGSFVKTVQDPSEGKDAVGGNRDYQNKSPGFDGTGQDKHKHNLGNGRGNSDRYTRRGRSRSRSRSRTRGRSRSRSLSRGRGRGRSRSRSSSQSDGNARDRMRSRSPGVDYRRQSHGWSDKRNAPDRSSRICRDFVAGKCRRGFHCRFFHPKSMSHGDNDALGDNMGESQRGTSDCGQISKSWFSKGPQSDMQGDVSDPYHRQGEQSRNKSKNAVPCKDFIKGRCRWGETCRFSHHLDNDVTFEKSSHNTSFSKDIELQPDKNEKVICKYFAAGSCDRDNCRFSHENSKLNSQDGRQDEATKDTKLHDMKSWSHPTSNDTSRIYDNVKPGGWSETIGTVTNSIGEHNEGKNNNRWGHILENENKGWSLPQWPDNSMNVDKQPFPPRTIGEYGGSMETVESIGKEELANKPEYLRLHGSHLQNLEGNANDQGQNTVQEDPKYFMELGQQHIPPILNVQQKHHGAVENNLGTSPMSGAVDELKNLGNSALSSLLSGQNLNQNCENVFTGLSSILDGTGGGQNMLSCIPTIESSGNLNKPEMHQAAPLNLESQMQNHLKAVQATRIVESKVPHLFPSLLTDQHCSHLADSTVAITDQHVPAAIPSIFPNQGFVNEQPRINTDLDCSNPKGMAPFSDISGNVLLVNAASVTFNQVSVSHDPKESGRGINEHENHTEKGSGMKMEQSYSLPTAGKEPDGLKGGHSGNQKLNQETLHTDPEVDESDGDNANENKGEQNNKHPVVLDSHGKVEEKGVNKDDKAMRAFKNSLIEFVKDILKPTWKEGQMSREVHKTIVKKVVDKVTSTIQADHIPKTQDKVEQYLSFSKPKIAKLVQAYVARCLKTDSGRDT